MKRLLSLLASFVVIAVAGTMGGAALYSIYHAVIVLVAGQRLTLFTQDAFVQGMYLSFPVALTFSSLFLTLYAIRHEGHAVIASIGYYALGALCWGLLIPGSMQLHQTHNQRQPAEITRVALTPGYFRKDGRGMFFFTTNSTDDNGAKGLYIDLSSDAENQNSVILVHYAPLEAADAQPFTDPLIKESIATPMLVKQIMRAYDILRNAANKALSKGYLNWVCFASMGFVLVCCYCFHRLRSWKLMNALLCIFTFFIALIFNTIFYGTTLLQPVQNFVEGWGGLFVLIPDSFLVLLNFTVYVVLVIVGVIGFIYSKHRGAAE